MLMEKSVYMFFEIDTLQNTDQIAISVLSCRSFTDSLQCLCRDEPEKVIFIRHNLKLITFCTIQK